MSVAVPITIPITDIVGNDEAAGTPRAATLISLLYRTVAPETWFVEGGTGHISAFFNPLKKQWYLVVFSASGTDVVNAVQSVLVGLKG